jgi:hypothetical protein
MVVDRRDMVLVVRADQIVRHASKQILLEPEIQTNSGDLIFLQRCCAFPPSRVRYGSIVCLMR